MQNSMVRSYFNKYSLAAVLVLVACIVGNINANAVKPEVVQPTPASRPPLEPVNRLDFPGIEEPLFAIGVPSTAETTALKTAVSAYLATTNYESLVSIENFLNDYPESPWRVAVQTNLGLIYYKNGAFSKAINAWEDAWKRGASATGRQQKVLVDRAYGELVRMHARLGHADRMIALQKESRGRALSGPATEEVSGANEGLLLMQKDHGYAYLCGPAALGNIVNFDPHAAKNPDVISKARSGEHGFSLAQVQELADKAGMNYQMVHRTNNAPLPLPVVVHWKTNHYAAVIADEGGKYHLKDPTFGNDLWIPKKVLDEESDGYFLIPKSRVSKDWLTVSMAEAGKIYGMGAALTSEQNRNREGDPTVKSSPCKPCGKGMPQVDVHAMLVSLNLKDTPVGYAPALGPSAYSTLTYNQREVGQPANFSFSNLGPKWTINWLSYIVDDPASAGINVSRYVSGGGTTYYEGYSSGQFAVDPLDGSVLVQISSDSYERDLKDGSKEIYAKSDAATVYPRRIFLTRIYDRNGKYLQLNYSGSGNVKLASITDAMGNTTVFGYENTSDDYLITDITPPTAFGMTAHIEYDDSGHLSSITDAEGMTSSFAYDTSEGGNADFIKSMTTPYGITKFSYSGTINSGYQSDSRWLEVAGPLLTDTESQAGKIERTEFRRIPPDPSDTSFPGAAETQVPGDSTHSGMIYNTNLNNRNSFYWDKRNYAKYCLSTAEGSPCSGAFNHATVMHWMHVRNPYSSNNSGVLESIKHPLESREWYVYPGEIYFAQRPGTLEQPDYIGRVVDGISTTARTKLFRNELGKVICKVTPENEVTQYEYASNKIDLRYVRRRNAAGTDCDSGTFDLVTEYGYTDTSNPHLPTTITQHRVPADAGYTTTFAYSSATGQIESVTNALGQQFTYDYSGNQLQTVTKKTTAPGDSAIHDLVVAAYTYDDVGRVKTFTNANSYTLTYDYDNLNRLKKITYPDSPATTDIFDYEKLDLVKVTDRQDNVRHMGYDAARNMTSQLIDASVWQENRTYYRNDALKYMKDGVGNVTAYVVDDQSRVTQTQRGPGTSFDSSLSADPDPDDTDSSKQKIKYEYDGYRSLLNLVTTAPDEYTTVQTAYEYDLDGRLKKVTDGNGNITQYVRTVTTTGQKLVQTSPDSGVTWFEYDLQGNLVKKTKAAGSGSDQQVINYGWDEIGRLESISYSTSNTGNNVTYVYDTPANDNPTCGYGTGNLCGVIKGSLSSPAATTDYKYNKLGQVIEEKVRPLGSGTGLVTSYGYDDDGMKNSITYPGGMVVSTPRVKSMITGLLSTLPGQSERSLATSVGYLPFGGLNSYNFAMNTGIEPVRYQQHFNMDGSMLKWEVSQEGGADVYRDYHYDNYGNVLTINDDQGLAIGTYVYDGVNRLTTASGAYGAYVYNYDNVGNRLSQDKFNWDATSFIKHIWHEDTTYISGTNRLNDVNRYRVVDDTQELTPYRTRTFVHDDRGNIKSDTRVKKSGTSTITSALQLQPGTSDRLNGISLNHSTTTP